jgi:hypothetical protein
LISICKDDGSAIGFDACNAASRPFANYQPALAIKQQTTGAIRMLTKHVDAASRIANRYPVFAGEVEVPFAIPRRPSPAPTEPKF